MPAGSSHPVGRRAGTPAPRAQGMQICIDMRPALSQSTGVGVYLQNLVGALAVLDPTNQYHLFSSSWKERYSPPVYGPNFQVHDRRWPVSVLNYAWNRLQFPSIESLTGSKLDVAHSPGPLMMPARRARRVITVHDLYFYAHPEQTSREIRRDYASMVRKHCERSDAIIAVSEHTRKQLTSWLNIPPARVCTIRHGADPFFAGSVPQEELERIRTKYNLRIPFYLFVGGRQPRKNLPALLKAFAALEPGAQLVLAGPRGAEQESVPGLVETGYVSREELRALYRQALALVMPSLDEGFGRPVLEALQSGTPVVASSIPAFHEVGGDAFLAVDPSQVESIAAGMQRIRDDGSLRQDLIAHGRERAGRFSWNDTAQKTLELYQSL